MESGSLSPTDMEAEMVVVEEEDLAAAMEVRRVWSLRERFGARERVKEIGAAKDGVGESNGLATEMAEEERSLETEKEVAMCLCV